ncbi:glycosyltransferase family 2 protein [Nitrospira moscoviensis]|nr:glycosyltransferase [Nitrospira moscoviensis]
MYPTGEEPAWPAINTKHPSDILVSVVVPTYRRPELLRRCLTELCAQTLDRTRYELVVVDDGLDDATRREVLGWAEAGTRPIIRYLTSPAPRSGPAVARNIGWRAARGGIIAFTDDDCRPLPEWLEAGCAAFADSAVSGAWGRIVVPIPDEPTDYERNTAGLEDAPCATANCFYRKTALHAVGGFDERFTAAWQEDSDLQFALLEARHQLVEVPDAVVVHPVRPASWGISIRQQRNNLFNALLFKKHPALYRLWIQASPPWHYYANAAALLGAAAGWTVESLWLLGPSLMVWTASVGQFCAKRLKSTSRRAAHVAEMVVTSALIPPVAVYWRLRGAIKYRVAFL